jgi:hypothetical protein
MKKKKNKINLRKHSLKFRKKLYNINNFKYRLKKYKFKKRKNKLNLSINRGNNFLLKLQIIYFLKYFLVLRKRLYNTVHLSKVKLSMLRFNNKLLIKKLKSNLSNYNITKKIRFNILKNLNTNKKDFNTVTKLYDIKKKYIRYFINNRLLYKIYNFKNKQNSKFYKNHFRFISSVDIKNRINFFENTIKNWVIKFKHSYSIQTSKFFINSGLLFLNGFQEFNYNKLFEVGDYLEFAYSSLTYTLKRRIVKKINKNI